MTLDVKLVQCVVVNIMAIVQQPIDTCLPLSVGVPLNHRVLDGLPLI